MWAALTSPLKGFDVHSPFECGPFCTPTEMGSPGDVRVEHCLGFNPESQPDEQ